ncbi:molecular chaperone [Rhodotorula kratochvilovae]
MLRAVAPRAALQRIPRTLPPRALCPTSLPPPRLPSVITTRQLSSTRTVRATTTSQSVYTAGASCPSCGTPFPRTLTPLCPSCSNLLPPPPPATTYFALFGLEPAYGVDVRALKKTFLQLQQKVHPDMFSGKGEVEDWAKTWSGKVNDAYKALVNERERGEYLLSLHDVAIGEADPVTDPELLMTIMEVREALEDARTEDEVAEIRQRNKEARKDAVDQLSAVFTSSSPDLERARELVIELRYLDNIDQVCREWAPGKEVPNLQH